MFVFKMIPLMLIFVLLSVAVGGDGVQGLYEVRLEGGAHSAQVRWVEIRVDSGDEDFRWYRLKCEKVGGKSFSVWFLASGDPFAGGDHGDIEFARYIVQEEGKRAIEYINKRSGRALLPIWDFAVELLPRRESMDGGALFEEGRYLGHPLIRREVDKGESVEVPGGIKRLVLNSELVMGTGRNFRDDGKGRKSRKDNYNYITFTKADYDEMIDAGINYFTVADEQVGWVCREAVFYDSRSDGVKFPEELYRSNYLGHSMFIDEPACRLAGKYPEGADTSVAIKMISEYIRNKQNKDYYRFGVVKAGIDIGDMKLLEPVPIWETYVGTSFYQLAANPYGFVQECRWKISPGHDTEQLCMLQKLNEDYNAGIEVSPENLFLWFYCQMRGAARIFGAKWGMSIYGQAEEELRLESMKLAYDMGASYIWFWTSDHDHHVPYAEQLELVREMRKYEEENRRPPLEDLAREAKTVIVLPWGYTLPSIWQLNMWGTHLYATDRVNSSGVTYKQVLKAAIKEVSRCLAGDIAYDVIPGQSDFDLSGYETVIRIKEDATVETSLCSLSN